MYRMWAFSMMAGVALVTMATPSLTHAKDLNITVTAGGEAYNGPPRFRLLADGKAIGEANVDNALQPKNGKSPLAGKGPTLSAVGNSLRKFKFTVPNGDTVSQYSIQFLNDDWGGPGSTLDRNLWISEVAIDGTRYSADKLTGDSKSSQIADGLAVLLMKGSLTLNRPANGWQTAAAAPSNAPGDCNGIEPLLIVGYGVGEYEIPADQVDKVTGFASASVNAGCSVTVSGLATPGGSREVNQRIGNARASLVKDKLAASGVKRIRIEVQTDNKERGVLLTARKGK